MASRSVTVDLGPPVVNLSGIRAGDKNEFLLNLSEAGQPYDLTGRTLTAQARTSYTAMGAPALTAVVTVIGDPLLGQAKVRWPGADVRTLLGVNAEWKGVWDLQEVVGVEDPITLIEGTFQAEQDVTR